MFRWQVLVGGALGVLGGLSVLSLAGNGEHRPQASGPILSECDGHLRELVMHYEPAASEIVLPVYRDFLRALGNDVQVDVVCPGPAAFRDLVSKLGRVNCRLRALPVNHPITTWSRDRWVALAPASAQAPSTLWSPRAEAGDAVWPGRAGDERVGEDVAVALSPRVAARRSSLFFDGGDFLADSQNVFVMPRVLPRNNQHTITNRQELVRMLTAELKRPVRLLAEAPDHHAGMFMASVGGRVMLMGDPSLARPFVTTTSRSGLSPEFMDLPGGADFTPETQHRFDAVASECAALGYRVWRIPVVPAIDGRTYLTYVNVLMDRQGERHTVYLPFYRGVEGLNAAARDVWEKLGFEVVPVDCTSVYRHFGCLHCLVNVLRRS